MSDKGIIFSPLMVRALLDGRKTQTRRLLKPAPPSWIYPNQAPGYSCMTPKGSIEFRGRYVDEAGVDHGPAAKFIKLPYHRRDRLYVRETWSVRGVYSDVVEVGYQASENRGHTEYVEQIAVDKAVPGKGKWPNWPKYGPSIHMPRWASRLWLAVTDVRVQRLQDCSEVDAIAEGLATGDDFEGIDARGWYRDLWDNLHTDEGTTWDANPWVVAVTFDAHRGNIDRDAA